MKKILLLVFFLQAILIQGQDIGSILKSNLPTKVKCEKLLKDLTLNHKKKGLDSALYIAKIADSLARKTDDVKLISDVLWAYTMVVSNSRKDLALSLAYDNFDICKKSNDCRLISKAYLLIANINYWIIGNTEKGLQNYEMSIKEAEKCKDKATLLEVYEESENIYFNTGQYEKNKQILFKKEKVDLDLKNDAWHNADIGDLYRNTKLLDSADMYYAKAISISRKNNDLSSTAQLYFNYALIPLDKKNYKTAIEYCKSGIEIAKILSDSSLMTTGNRQLYSIYYKAADFSNAKACLSFVIKQHEKEKATRGLIADYRRMSELNYELKNYKAAYISLRTGIELFDSQNNAQESSNVTKVEEGNLKKQKQLEIDLINEQKKSERKIKNISFIALGAAFLLICGIVFSLLKLKKSRDAIFTQKQEVEKQKHLIEEKNKEIQEKQMEILDSIRYARRIQISLLPTDKYIDKSLTRLHMKGF